MRAVVQRVCNAELIVVANGDERTHASIGRGLVVLVGIESADADAELAWLSRKVVGLRIFEDDAGKMNRSIADLAGESAGCSSHAASPGILMVPNFTVAGRAHKGRRPDFTNAKRPDEAKSMFDALVETVRAQAADFTVVSGVFGAHMHVRLANDGPITIWLDSNE